MNVLGIYAPEEGKKTETSVFYQTLQSVTDKLNKNEYLIIAGNFNARIGKTTITDIIGLHSEDVRNWNGDQLRDFATFNNLRITNSFFPHKDIHKFTWSARGSRSIIDYVLINNKLTAFIHDKKVYRGFDIHSDHFLVVSSLNILVTSIRYLYQQRMDKILERSQIQQSITEEWQ